LTSEDAQTRKREYNREYYAANRAETLAKKSAHYRQNRTKIIEKKRESRSRSKIAADNARRRHGMQPEDLATLWNAQGGRCYLCGEALSGDVTMDHDHDCCPQNKSCAICRRGIAHNLCNAAIGFAGDDPALLRRMADALETAQAEVERRKIAALQVPLFQITR